MRNHLHPSAPLRPKLCASVQDSRRLCVLRTHLLMLLAPGAGDDCAAVLDAPPQQHLSRRPAQLLGNAVDLLILQAWQLSKIMLAACAWRTAGHATDGSCDPGRNQATAGVTGKCGHAGRDHQANPNRGACSCRAARLPVAYLQQVGDLAPLLPHCARAGHWRICLQGTWLRELRLRVQRAARQPGLSP